MHVVCRMDTETNRTKTNKSNNQNEKVEKGRQQLINQEEEKEKCPYPYAALLKTLLKLFPPLSHFYKKCQFFPLLFLQCFKVFHTVD